MTENGDATHVSAADAFKQQPCHFHLTIKLHLCNSNFCLSLHI